MEEKIPVMKALRAIAARLLFSLHGLLTIWRAAYTFDDNIFLLFSLLIVLIFIEGAINIFQRHGNETRWFCSSIFLYLCGTVPPLWFLEKDLRQHHRKRLAIEVGEPVIEDDPVQSLGYNYTTWNQTQLIELIELLNARPRSTTDKRRNCEDYYPSMPDGSKIRVEVFCMGNEMWVPFLEQTLLVVLIIGRWILPKGEISRDQLSQILLVYLATAADIIELFETFKEPRVLFDLKATEMILIIWMISLLQFCLVVAFRGRKSRFGAMQDGTASSPKHVLKPTATLSSLTADVLAALGRGVRRGYFSSIVFAPPKPVWKRIVGDWNVWGLSVNLCLQDGPFLAMRLYLLIHHRVVSYSMIFFTCKNTLICVLLLYRLVAIIQDHIRKHHEETLPILSPPDVNRTERTVLCSRRPTLDEAAEEVASVIERQESDENGNDVETAADSGYGASEMEKLCRPFRFQVKRKAKSNEELCVVASSPMKVVVSPSYLHIPIAGNEHAPIAYIDDLSE